MVLGRGLFLLFMRMLSLTRPIIYVAFNHPSTLWCPGLPAVQIGLSGCSTELLVAASTTITLALVYANVLRGLLV